MALPSQKFILDEEETDTGTPIRYLPLHHVYSTSSPCVSASGSSNVMSKKVKAQKLVEAFDGDLIDCYDDDDDDGDQSQQKKTSSFRVYTRRGKKAAAASEKPSLFDSTLVRVKSEPQSEDNLSENFGFEGNDCTKDRIDESGVKEVRIVSEKVRRRMGNNELVQLGVDSSILQGLGSPRLRESRARNMTNGSTRTRKRKLSSGGTDSQKGSSGSAVRKRWFELSYKDVDPSTFIGLTCKVYWPLDDHWYSGSITGFNSETKQHQVKYEDGDSESFTLSKEKIKFCLLREEMQRLNLRCSVTNKDNDGLDYSEMLVLAAGFDDCEEPGPGDIIWGKLSGYAMWPAVVVNDSDVCALKGLQTNPGDKSVLVQFFGTHDFARISMKQVVSFLRGLLGSFHLKCSKPQFRRSLEEAKMYLGEQKLPNKMKQLRDGTQSDDSASGEDEETVCSGDDKKGIVGTRKVGCKTCPFEVGDLRVLNLGRIVEDSEYFHTERYIWPEGYTATRKFISVTDPSVKALYKMEVLRDPEAKFRPLFKVTLDNGEEILLLKKRNELFYGDKGYGDRSRQAYGPTIIIQGCKKRYPDHRRKNEPVNPLENSTSVFKGSTPSACWNKIYEELRETQDNLSNGFHGEVGSKRIDKSGSHMFGFSNPKVFKLIQELSYSRLFSISSACNLASDGYRDLPAGYRPVRVDWKDLDKCNVCYMDEEYENNVFLQCDKCRMMVHARCYGELEPVDGILWLCNLCRPGAPKSPPPCCLCPVIGGAMKPTADGRWAHLACAIWIPETCLSDIKKMEPIDGLNRISKDRWKLLCSICGVSYGACIQCSNSTCRVAYHPLCARAAGLCVELEDEDKLDIMSFDEEDDDDQCIRLFSFCKKHRQSSDERSTADEHFGPIAPHCSNYTPPINPSGCARSEPYDFIRRRGPKEPEALAAASLKRLFVENRPYLVSGSCQNGTLGNSFSPNELVQSRFSSKKLKTSQLETPNGVLSMAEKYKYMRATFRKRLAFGKSRIHGFGVFAKHPHRAGDMVIEYSGELVRLSIADKREHFIYNSLVGAGTYMFRIDDERVIDATKAGSIAHLINHSCKPNCFSRVISVHGDEHIIIFAKRDIKKWEELTYDYRFFSIDEQLACYCGFPKCRGVVNDIDTEEQVAKLSVPRSKLIDWTEE